MYDTALLPHRQMPARTNVSVLCANASHDKEEGQLPLQGFGVRQLMAFKKKKKKERFKRIKINIYVFIDLNKKNNPDVTVEI